MFGIGPLLPVLPAAEECGQSSKKVRNRKVKRNPSSERHELAIMRCPSTLKTESTLFEDDDESVAQEALLSQHHQRDHSLIVGFDLDHAATQLNDGEISDLDLALFAFWIKANHDNYVMAKGLIRELALDQGYNIDKITNHRVRKLLQEVHDIRPRDPRHESTSKTPFHGQTQSPGVRMRSSGRTVCSPLIARVDTLPPSLRLKRELAIQEAARSTMASSDTTDYPPNTPDRPAPLSVKSRGSQISNSTPISTNILRSVSAPIRTQPQSDLRPLPQRDSTVKTGGTEALGLSVTAAKDSCRNRGGVFGAAHQRDSNRHNHFIDKLQSSEYRRYGTPGKYMYPDSDGRSLGPYQLDASDIASESSDGTFKSLRRKNRNQPSTGTSYDVGIIGYESFDALDSYIGSEDEEKGSILESASNTSEEAPTPYQFAVQQSPSKSIIAGPVPSPSEHRAAADARRNTQPPSISAQGVNFHRPLPLRSYESEAIMFPTADAQTNSSIRRSKSVTSIIASRRPAIETMAVPCVTNSLQARDSFEEQVDQEAASFSQRSSSASTLAAFPIPPMDNPVGQLPMLVSRAVSSPHSLRTTRSQHPVASASLEDTYRAIVQVAMDAVLQRTRSQAKGLPPVDWNRLTSFERAWREMNALLLVTIYGRTDAVLTETDIDYIDRVAEVLRNESADTESTNWVRRMFEAEN